MAAYSSYIWIALIAGAGFALVYLVLPRVFKSYDAEKGVKLLLLYGMIGYLCYDFYMKDKPGYIVVFVLGAAAFTYMVIIAKKKE